VPQYLRDIDPPIASDFQDLRYAEDLCVKCEPTLVPSVIAIRPYGQNTDPSLLDGHSSRLFVGRLASVPSLRCRPYCMHR
jgi:hypothetical protein